MERERGREREGEGERERQRNRDSGERLKKDIFSTYLSYLPTITEEPT